MGNTTYAYLAGKLGLGSTKLEKLSVELEDHFQANEVWLSDRGNHTKWSKALAERLIASKMLIDDEWFKKVLELGYRVITATKKLVADKKLESADKELVAANTLVDAADQVMAVAELRTEGATLEAAAGQTRNGDGLWLFRSPPDQPGFFRLAIRNTGYNAAKAEEEMVAVNVEMAKKVGALKIEAAEIVAAAAKDEAEAAALKLAREKLLSDQEVACVCPHNARARIVGINKIRTVY
ncbi:hypothetical protein FN846DRAFT_921129 [Sphaerosporella brunnea]|uniref:Uncharacterized protein n=1 Tax=Sphaerosporella brunnea TaxID=1250544 RepID=A0A5J5EQ37_9PEZI|nr:hypothetical protein FN846DRAFT_921129 [Sphaerosporella brunnea]